jgi:RNA polymerase sigma-70 factor (ECF subfamily)
VSIDWAEVYRSTFPELVRFLHRKVWDPDRARDLAQETFVRALENEPDQPRAWLFRVAGNLARDEARAVVRRKRHLSLLKSDAQPGDGADPASDLEDRERWDQVRTALDALGERDREVLLLWDAGLAYPDIAEQTGLAVGSIGTTLARARRRLVEAFGAEESEDVAHR